MASAKDLRGGRFDPDYYSDFYKEIIQKIKLGNYNTICLKNVCLSIFSGKTPASSDYSDVETEYPIIKVSSYDNHQVDISKVTFAKNKQPYSIQKGDIFILSAAHQAEYVGKHIKILEETPAIDISFVGELLCIRVNKKFLNPIFLFSLLNTDIYKTLINREKTGQTSHIYPKDIKNIEIPLPPIEKQQEIATHIQGIRNKALALQKEAENVLIQAKNQVEQMILGS